MGDARRGGQRAGGELEIIWPQARRSRRARWLSRSLAVVLAMLLLLPAATLAAPGDSPDRVYFSQTGHDLAYGFLDYWRHQGGLMLFGYPITEEFTDASTGLTVQYFERAVFEYHPENPAPYRILLRRLGALQTAGRQDEPPFQPIVATTNQSCTFYQPTGHRLCFGFRDEWNNQGGLATFGYPISEEFTENGLTVQYFERARFEYHPNNPPRYQVLLGLLGDAAAQQANVNSAPVAASPSVAAYAPNLWPPERCRAWQLQLTEDGGSAAAGSRETIFVLRNSSDVTCTLYGYPGMLMLDEHGNPMTTNVIRGEGFAFTMVAPREVTIGPGEAASFAVGYHAIPTGDQSHEVACPESSRLEVTPPDDFNQLNIAARLAPCEGTFYVSPVVAGAAGPSS